MMKLAITLIIFALISFFVDTTTLYCTYSHLTNALLCVYLYCLVYVPIFPLLCSIGTLLTIQDLIIFGHAGIQLLYLIPLTFISYEISHIMYPNTLQLITTTFLAIMLQTVCIKWGILAWNITPFYTVQMMYGTVIGVVLISLIIRLSGLLGNRIRA